MTTLPIGPSAVSSGVTPPKSKDSPEKIRDAASQFEALLISQVLKSAHDGEEQGLMGGSDPASSSAMDFATDYFARALAAQGGLGLTAMITKSLEHAAASSSNRETPAPIPPGTPKD